MPLAMPGPGFGDLQTGMALAGGIGAALYQRERTGRASVVDVSLMSMGLWAMGMTISGTQRARRRRPPPPVPRHSTNPLVNDYRTKDDQLHRLAFLQSDRYWPEFCVLVDELDWLADERFADSPDARGDTARRGRRCSTSCSPSRPSPSGRTIALQAGRPVGRAAPGRPGPPRRAGPGQRLRPARRARRRGKVVLVPAPAQFDGEAPALGRAPTFGADTDAVLRGQGLDDDAIADLRARGIIR